LNPCPHAVHGLLAIFLALVLRHRRQQVFNELRVGILTKLDGRADQHAASIADLHAQLKVSHQPPCKAADVINDNGMGFFTVGRQKAKHGLHARARGQTARTVITEDLNNLIALVIGKLAAAGFLRAKAITAHRLLRTRNAAVDDGLAKPLCFILKILHYRLHKPVRA